MGDLVRTADTRNVFSNGYSINWGPRLQKIANDFDDTFPSNTIKKFEERYKEALL